MAQVFTVFNGKRLAQRGAKTTALVTTLRKRTTGRMAAVAEIVREGANIAHQDMMNYIENESRKNLINQHKPFVGMGQYKHTNAPERANPRPYSRNETGAMWDMFGRGRSTRVSKSTGRIHVGMGVSPDAAGYEPYMGDQEFGFTHESAGPVPGMHASHVAMESFTRYWNANKKSIGIRADRTIGQVRVSEATDFDVPDDDDEFMELYDDDFFTSRGF